MFSRTSLLVFCVVFLAAVSVSDGRTRRARPRFLTFNTFDGDVSVELEFTIPFITIPVKKAMESFGTNEFSLPSVNINLAAVFIGAVMVTTTAVFLPMLLKSFAQKSPNSQYRRLLDNTEFGADAVFDFANQLLLDGRSFQGCAQRVACWTARGPSREDVGNFLGQIHDNQILSTMLNATAIEEALSSGHLGRDCSLYGPCSLRDDHIPMFFSNLIAFGRRGSEHYKP